MRDLTEQEQSLLRRREEAFEQFLADRLPVLADFMDRIEVPNGARVVVEPDRFVAAIDAFLRDQTIADEDRSWIHVRVGYFIGEWLIQRFGGHWFVNRLPDTRYFGRYVVGRFSSAGNHDAMVEPFLVAEAYLSESSGRCLSRMLDELASEVATFGPSNDLRCPGRKEN